MKNLIFSVLLICAAFAGYGQSPPISRGEYFVDVDPGPGSATTISVTRADSVSNSLTISSTGLAAGPHKLYVRYADSVGKWGTTQIAPFTITDTSTAAAVVTSPRVKSGEYFFDTDPGTGSGIALTVTTSDSVSNSFTASSTGLGTGAHKLYVRYADSTGKWGTTQIVTFTITDTSTAAVAVTTPRVKSGEYFFDTDPGTGSGIALTVTTSDSVSNSFTVSSTGLPPGVHKLYVRYADSTGKWGTTQFAQFTVTDTSTPPVVMATPRLIKGEYFVDVDPGTGSGTAITVTTADSVSGSISLSTTGVSPGTHTIYVRFADSTGKWGNLQNVQFGVIDTSFSLSGASIPRIKKGEYFIDVDPGVGNGVAITATMADSVASSLSVSSLGLVAGGHTLYVRYADSVGKWGTTQGITFNIIDTSTVATAVISPRIKKGEYFVDIDPGVGSGIAISVTMGDSVASSLTVSSTGLVAGAHKLYVRYADSTGKWGTTQSAQFNITDTSTAATAAVSPKIAKGEYFIDTDPGPNNGTALPSFTAADSIAQSLTIATTSLAVGSHTAFIRYKDSLGKWGQTVAFQFNVCSTAVYLAPVAGANNVCVSTTTTLTDSTTGGTWTSSAPAIATVSSAGIVTGLTTGSVNISYAISGACGSAFVTKNLIVNAGAPSLSAISGSSSVCAGSTLALSNSTNGGTWSSSNLSLATVNGAGLVSAIAAGTDTVFYNVTNFCGSATVSKVVTINALPSLTATPGVAAICSASSTTITAAGATTYTWLPTTGLSASTGTTVTCSATATTLYTLTGTSAAGCVNSVTQNITVNAIPTVTSTAVNPSLCTGGVSSTGITAAGGTSYTWLPVTALSATTGATVTASPTVTTIYTITATNASGCVATGTRSISVGVTPTVTVTPALTTVCYGSTTSMTASGATTYSWTPGSSLTGITGTTVNCTPTSATVYTIVGTNAAGCTATAFQTINVTALPVVSVSAVSPSICSGSSTNITAAGGSTYSWLPATGLSATTGATVTCNTTLSTTYTVTGTASGCSASVTTRITVGPVSISAFAGSPTICSGTSTSISAFGATTYTWSPSTGLSATTGNRVTCSATTATTYTVTGNTSSGCSNTATVSVNVTTSPTVTASPGSANICAGGSASIGASGATTYSWSPASALSTTTGASVTATPTVTTVYTVTGTNASGCSGTATSNVTVLIVPTFVAPITGDTNACAGYTTILSDTTNAGTWSSSNPSVASVTGGVVTGVTYGSAIITYTVANSCGSVSTTRLVNVNSMHWLGTTSSDWNTASNWSCGYVPAVTDDITIDTGRAHSPAIASSASGFVHNIVLIAHATVTIGTGATLNLKGNVTNNGIINGAGKMSMNGTSAQTITGIAFVNNINLNNSAGVTISAGSRLTVSNLLSVTSGTLVTNDSLVLYADSTNTARVDSLPGGTGISGQVKIMVYVEGGRRAYRFWSHPFSNYIGLSQVQNYIDVTGAGGSSNGFTVTASNSPSAFRYNPLVGNSSLPSDPGWRQFANTNTTTDSNRLHQYQAIRLFFRGVKGEGLGYGTYTPSPVTVAQWGNLNQGTQTITLAKGSANPYQEYNMVGNPYASPTDIGTVIYNGLVAGNVVGPAYFVWNPCLGSAGQFAAQFISTVAAVPYYVQACNAVQVRAANNGSTLTFRESNKGGATTTNLFRAAPEYVSIKVYDAAYHPYDMLYLQFNDSATANNDYQLDAVKPMGGASLNFYSISADSVKMIIDSRPYCKDKVIPLGISSSYTEDYIFKTESLALPDGGELYLHDKLLKQFLRLQEGTEYRFTITGNDASQGDNRFELSMKPEAIQELKNIGNLKVTLSPNPATDEVAISYSSGNKEAVHISISDVSGVNVYSKDLGLQQSGVAIVPLAKLAPGLYMVQVASGDRKVVQRLIKE